MQSNILKSIREHLAKDIPYPYNNFRSESYLQSPKEVEFQI
jgi:hypothetical protein